MSYLTQQRCITCGLSLSIWLDLSIKRSFFLTTMEGTKLRERCKHRRWQVECNLKTFAFFRSYLNEKQYIGVRTTSRLTDVYLRTTMYI